MTENSEEINYKSPIYLQLRELIRTKINEGEFLPGTCLPSENEMAATYGVNRLTVRNAMTRLVNEGLLKRVQGKGVYVVPERLERDLEKLGGFVQVAREKHSALITRVLVKAVRRAGDKYAFIFGLQPEDEIFFIKRLCTVEEEPVSLEEVYIPRVIFPRLGEIDLAVFTLEQAYEFSGVRIVRADQVLDLATLEANDARTLGINTHTAVMVFESQSYDAEERVVQFSRTYTRGDKCDFHVKFSE